MYSVSRCSISPSGQFTIGNLNADAPSTRSSYRPSHAEEKPAAASSQQAVPSQERLHPTEVQQASLLSAESTVVEEKESVFLSDDGGDFGPDDGGEPAPVEEEEEEVKKNDPWHLEDVYDGSQNRVAPYSRGNVLMDKKQVTKQNELTKKRSQLHRAVDEEQEKSLFFHIGAAEFDVFSYGQHWCVSIDTCAPA